MTQSVLLETYWEEGVEEVYWAVEDLAPMGEGLRRSPRTGRPQIYYRNPYAGLIMLEAGHELTIYADYAENQILWQGTVQPETRTNRHLLPWISPYFNESQTELLDLVGCQTALRYYGFGLDRTATAAQCRRLAQTYCTRQLAAGLACHWLQKGVDPDEWADWFSRKLPATLYS